MTYQVIKPLANKWRWPDINLKDSDEGLPS